jgi:hypothetical protein
MELSEQSRLILEAIAKGHTYEQILVQDLAWTYHDIFRAVAEALEIIRTATGEKFSVEDIRQDHPRAYEKWNTEEDGRLRQLFHSGNSVKQIAEALQRQPGAIRSQLAKLNLVDPHAGSQPDNMNGLPLNRMPLKTESAAAIASNSISRSM